MCVGYAERKYPFYSKDADEGGGEGGAKGGEPNKLPYCEGILMLVTDKEGGLEKPPRAARVVKERTRDADEDADTIDASTSGGEGPARAGRPLPGLGVPGLSSDGARARERGAEESTRERVTNQSWSPGTSRRAPSSRGSSSRARGRS